MHFETRAIHRAGRPDKAYGAVSVPIYQASTFAYDDIGKSRGYNYSREANPTRQALEDTLADLEGGKRGFAFASGMAAESAVAHLLKAGDHVIVVADPYGGTYRLFTDIMPRYGITASFAQLTSRMTIDWVMQAETRMVWIESPTNPLLNIVDLDVVSEIARGHHLLTVIDNTFATPYSQRPLEHGIDIVLHSLTKYLGGHSDVIGGAVVTSDVELANRIYLLQKALGGILGPFDSWLVLRGIETLAVRMDRHAANALVVAQFLEQHPAVARALYPGLPGHPGHEIAKRQMSGFGGMVSFELKAGLPGAEKFLRSIKVFTLADSLGGTHSLAEAPYLQSHASMDAAYRQKIGITPGLIRLSVGLENIDDLLADLTQALNW